MENLVEIKSGNELQIFEGMGFRVRTVIKDGEPWFVSKDVAEILGYSNTRDAIARHCKKQVTVAKHDGGQITLIPESDVYRLIIRSKLPSAEKFENWLMEEVLPSIRKTGSYSVLQKPDSYMIEDPIKRAYRWVEEKLEHQAEVECLTEKVTDLKEELAEVAPKAEIHDRIVDATNLKSVGDTAKILGRGRNSFFKQLRDDNILQANNVPYQRYIDAGYFKVKVTVVVINFQERSQSVTYVTGKGTAWLAGKYGRAMSQINQTGAK